MRQCDITPVADEDAAAIAAIYAHHVLHGDATFETRPPSEAETRHRIAAVRDAGWPYLVARAGGDLVGYAYAVRFRERTGFQFTCEDSIYVAADRRGGGIGSALLAALIAAAERGGFRQMIAVIGGPEPASLALHARFGFVESGRLVAVGRKHGRWLDTVTMQRPLGEGSKSNPPFEPA